MIVILYLIKIILAWRDQRKSVRKNRIMWRTRNTRESRTDDFSGWAVTHQQTHTFLFIYYYFILRVFFFLVWEAPDRNRLNRDSVLIERLYIHRVRERDKWKTGHQFRNRRTKGVVVVGGESPSCTASSRRRPWPTWLQKEENLGRTALPTRFSFTPSFSLFSGSKGEKQRERGSIERHIEKNWKPRERRVVCVCVVTYFSLSNRFQTTKEGEHLLKLFFYWPDSEK